MKYIQIEITDDYQVKITPTDSDSWLGQYYITGGVIIATTCLESKKDIYLSKILDKAFEDIEIKMKQLSEWRMNLTKLKKHI